MKVKPFKILLFTSLIVSFYLVWLFFLPATRFSENKKFLYIKPGNNNLSYVMNQLTDSSWIRSGFALERLGRYLDLDQKLQSGKFEISSGMSLFEIARVLKNNRQSIVRLTITKFRTKEQLASFIGKKFETDSAQFKSFLDNNDSLLVFGIDTTTFLGILIPDSYDYYWISSPAQILKKLEQGYRSFWSAERIEKAAKLGLTPLKATILASIVEEETNSNEEKGNIASVYLNRISKGMPLQADPTVKYALRNFALKRIYEKHLVFDSPYNTYKHTGWPPGPICTPSKATLDAVLNAPSTNYYYFVAKSDFSGRHVFSETYDQHLIRAKEFQQAQNVQEQLRKSKAQ
jgi:UPF0755 protein